MTMTFVPGGAQLFAPETQPSLPMTMTFVPGGAQDFAPETQPSPASRPESPVRNQHFCSPSSVPHTQNWHSGKERQTFVHDSISLATNLSELMQSSRKQPIVAPYPWRLVKSAWPAFRITVFCSWHAGQFCAAASLTWAMPQRRTAKMGACPKKYHKDPTIIALRGTRKKYVFCVRSLTLSPPASRSGRVQGMRTP